MADGPTIAESLYDALTGAVPAGDPVYLDVPLPNDAARGLAAAKGLTPGFETARMYTGPAPDVELERVYGVTTFELGLTRPPRVEAHASCTGVAHVPHRRGSRRR